MLARNWAVVADQGPTAQLRRTKREKCDSAAAYEMKEKQTKKHKKGGRFALKRMRQRTAIFWQFLLVIKKTLRPNSFVAIIIKATGFYF